MIKDALISPDGQYRYWLMRQWDSRYPCLGFLMLNPSTADAKVDDPTIRKCIGFANQNGYGSIRVVNLFAYRTPSPQLLARAGMPIGIDNDLHIKEQAAMCEKVVAAWGASFDTGRASYMTERVKNVVTLLKDTQLYCLRTTKSGMPWHPLMLSYSCRLTPWQSPV
jgi:hypothetical protein